MKMPVDSDVKQAFFLLFFMHIYKRMAVDVKRYKKTLKKMILFGKFVINI